MYCVWLPNCFTSYIYEYVNEGVDKRGVTVKVVFQLNWLRRRSLAHQFTLLYGVHMNINTYHWACTCKIKQYAEYKVITKWFWSKVIPKSYSCMGLNTAWRLQRLVQNSLTKLGVTGGCFWTTSSVLMVELGVTLCIWFKFHLINGFIHLASSQIIFSSEINWESF